MKILIVDDHALVRKGIRTLLASYNPGWEIHEAINGIQAVIMAPKIFPDLVLMDYAMPKLNGHKAARQMMKDIPGIKILIVSGFIASNHINDLLDSGILGIVSKTAGTEELMEAVYNVSSGKKYLTVESSLGVPDLLTGQMKGEGSVANDESARSLLTPREREVMELIVKGHSSAMIIQQLAISPKTLDTHKVNIFRKCDIHSTAELVRYAYKNNLT